MKAFLLIVAVSFSAGITIAVESSWLSSDICTHRQNNGAGYFCEGTCSPPDRPAFPIRLANQPSRAACITEIEARCR